MLRWLPILFLITGCASVNRGRQIDPPVPTPSLDPRSVPLTSIISHAQPAFVGTPPVHHSAYTWDYEIPMPADNIAFDFEGSTNLIDWYLIVTTNQPPVRFDTYQWNEYYRVVAHWIIDPN